jgi:hypothetical protein
MERKPIPSLELADESYEAMKIQVNAQQRELA